MLFWEPEFEMNMEASCKEAVRISTETRHVIHFCFSGIPLRTVPGDNPQRLIDSWDYQDKQRTERQRSRSSQAPQAKITHDVEIIYAVGSVGAKCSCGWETIPRLGEHSGIDTRLDRLQHIVEMMLVEIRR